MPIVNTPIGSGGGITSEEDPSALKIASNLSDLQSLSAARTNLNVQTISETAESEFIKRMSSSELTIPMATNWSVSTSSGGTVTVGDPTGRTVNGPYTAAGFAQTTLDAYVLQRGIVTITPGSFNWNRRIVISFRLMITRDTTSSSVRMKFHLGTAGGAGIGIQKWGHQSLRFLNHDGTTERVIDTAFVPTRNVNYDFLIDADGQGNSKLYINGNLAASSAQANLTNTDNRFQLACYATQAVPVGSEMAFTLSNLKFKSFDSDSQPFLPL